MAEVGNNNISSNSSASSIPQDINKIELGDTALKQQGFSKESSSGNNITQTNPQQPRSRNQRSRRGRYGNKKNTIGAPGIQEVRREAERQSVTKQLRREGERIITQEEMQYEPEACVRYLFQPNFGRQWNRNYGNNTNGGNLGNNNGGKVDWRRRGRGRRGGRGRGGNQQQQQQQQQPQQPLDQLKQQGVLQEPIQALDSNKGVDTTNIYNNIRPIGQGRRQRNNRRRYWKNKNDSNGNNQSEKVLDKSPVSETTTTTTTTTSSKDIPIEKAEEKKEEESKTIVDQGKDLVAKASDMLNDALISGASSPKNRAPGAPREAIEEYTPMDAAKGLANSFAEQAGQIMTDIKDTALSTFGLSSSETVKTASNPEIDYSEKLVPVPGDEIRAIQKEEAEEEKKDEIKEEKEDLTSSGSVLETTKGMLVGAFEAVKEKTSEAIEFIADKAEAAGLTLENEELKKSWVAEETGRTDIMSEEKTREEVLQRGVEVKKSSDVKSSWEDMKSSTNHPTTV